MENLRWILLVLGALVIVGVYIFTVINKKQRRDRFARQFSTVDWETPTDEKKEWPSDEMPSLSTDEGDWEDELPSMDELEAARIQHRAEGHALSTQSPEFVEELPQDLNTDIEPEPQAEIVNDTVTSSGGIEAFKKNLSLSDEVQPQTFSTPVVEEEKAEPATQAELETQNSFDFISSPRKVEEVIISLHVKATDSIGFYGPKLHACLEELGIKHGEMDIYHYASQGKRILSIANMVKPGTFDLDQIQGFTTPGITLFLQLSKESDFELSEKALVQSAKYIAHKLNGEVLDDQRNLLNNQKEKEIIQQIREAKDLLR